MCTMIEEDSRMSYSITMRVEGRYNVEVEAESLDEAIQKASDAVCEANFGELEDTDPEYICAIIDE